MQSNAVDQAQALSGKRQNQEEAAKRKAEQELMKGSILTQIMDKSAMARLSNLRVVKPEKAQAVETMLVNMARSGQVRNKMNDDDLRRMLDQISTNTTTKRTKVKYDRRRAAVDSDESEEATNKQVENSSDSDT